MIIAPKTSPAVLNFFRAFAVMLMCAAALLISASSVRAAEDALTKNQQDEVRALVKDYLLKNPGIIVDALDAYQRDQQAMQQKQFESRIKTHKDFIFSESAAAAGNPKGDITIVEFFDYNCGYCKHAVEDVVKIVEQDKNVHVVFHEMPILSETSMDAARWSLASAKQGKYFEFHKALMKDVGPRNRKTFEKVAKAVGLDVEKLAKDAEEDKEIRQTIEKSLEVARDLGIRGTPAFIIGDILAPGYMGYDNMKKAVADTRAARAGGNSGTAPEEKTKDE